MTTRAAKRARSSVAEHEEPMSACSACKEPIRKGATKCVHCQSYQGIWRPLGVSSVVLSLLVALIAVIGTTAGALRSVFHTPSAHVGFAVQGAVAHQIAV